MMMNLRKKGSFFFLFSSFFLLFYRFCIRIRVKFTGEWNEMDGRCWWFAAFVFVVVKECLVWVFITFSAYWRVFCELVGFILFGERAKEMKKEWKVCDWRNFKVLVLVPVLLFFLIAGLVRQQTILLVLFFWSSGEVGFWFPVVLLWVAFFFEFINFFDSFKNRFFLKIESNWSLLFKETYEAFY